MKKIIISLLGLSILSLAQANEKTGELKSSVTIQATCNISIDSINFGAVATPLMMQSAQSDMTVKCSNASAYTVNLAYGGIYGTGTTSELSLKFDNTNIYVNQYNMFNSLGVRVGHILCGHSDVYRGQVYFNSVQTANLYGYTISGWQPDNKKTGCVSNNTATGTYPVGWVGAYNATNSQPIGPSTGYNYGVMNGMSKGDKLAYSIQVPGEPNKVWNSGTNSYKSTGNGDNQTIPMVAKIVPDKSGSKYPAPDMYLDTITAIISY